MAWRGEYLAALKVRDAQELANKEVYDAYAKLADRSVNVAEAPAVEGTAPSSGTSANAVQMQTDLVEAQKARGDLTKRLSQVTEELEQLQLKSTAEGKRIEKLTMEKALLVRKVRDRDEELKEKAKMFDNLHDDHVVKDIEINALIEKNDKLINENRELVDRWLARKEQEVEAMNTASKFS